KEGTIVFSHVLRANQEDLEEVARRLAGTEPDANDFTVLLQEEVEGRTRELLEALRREQQRRQQEQQQQQQQQQQNRNQQGQQPLVPIVAELKMLKQMEQDMMERTQ